MAQEHRPEWTEEEVTQLREARDQGLSPAAIHRRGLIPTRTFNAIRGKAHAGIRVGKRGVVPGGIYRKWSDDEWAVIDKALDTGMTAGQIHKQGLLPDRDAINIQNSLNRRKWKRNRRCHCGNPLALGDKENCADCKVKHRERQRAQVRAGLCASCNRDRTGGSATLCPDCMARRRKKHSRIITSTKPGGLKIPSPFPWPGSLSGPVLERHVPKGFKVVDLFAGAGKLSQRLRMKGRTILALNDAHPLLTKFMYQIIREGREAQVIDEIQWLAMRFSGRPDVLARHYQTARKFSGYPPGAALFYVMARSCKGRMNNGIPEYVYQWDRQLPRRAGKLYDLFRGTAVTNLDYLTAIKFFDSPSTFFVVDPPWPEDRTFEHSMDGRHRELVEALLGAKGSWALILQSSEASLRALRGVPYLYWSLTVMGKEIFASNLPCKMLEKHRFTLDRFLG